MDDLARPALCEINNRANQRLSGNHAFSPKKGNEPPTTDGQSSSTQPLPRWGQLSGFNPHAMSAHVSRAGAEQLGREGLSSKPREPDTTWVKQEHALSARAEEKTFQRGGPAHELDSHPGIRGEPSAQDIAPLRLNMSDLFDGRTPEQLEKGVEKGMELLEKIQRTLGEVASQEVTRWAESIDKIQSQAGRSRTVIGVVGATGAGKSSVINAMLDEERLVPTNCMRACTAVVTEISYNYQEGAPFKAEVEFISKQDWRKMLNVLFQDLLDQSGQVSRECTNEDSESGVAYAQVKAVYPRLTREEMTEVPIDKLMEHPNVACLGTKRSIESEDAMSFYKQLQRFVDSKEKTTGVKERVEKEKKPREQEYWPLIRVVKLYVKAPALATGAVIVDLPGVHDSNQARAAVAKDYMKQCTGLLIVAPITRAVDDKSAKTLLGDSFKRQLKMDGGLSSVTFICSKTDDISITEAQDSLGLEEELAPMWAELGDLEKKKDAMKIQIKQLQDSRSDVDAAMDSAEDEMDTWEKLQEKLIGGKIVFRPHGKRHKRRLSDASSPARKKPKYAEPDSDDDLTNSSDECASNAPSNSASSNTSHDRGEPLTEDEIADKITELRGARKEWRRERSRIDEQIQKLRARIQEVGRECEDINAKLSCKCIAGRNEYSRGAIRQDYAAGIRELDQELAEEEDAANFDPEVDARDYDEVARNLPVFCVSSRAYQKLKGRLRRDRTPPGFQHIDETEVPALQAHCVQLTATARQACARKFLTSMFQLLNSLRLWASNDSTPKNLTEEQMGQEAQMLREMLSNLDSGLEKAGDDIVDRLVDELDDKVYDAYPHATTAARAQADDIVQKWGSPVNRSDRAAGGLYWATYKAVVRRDGCFTNAQGCHNFNAQLLEPLIRHLAGPWESVFTRRMPIILNGLSTNVVHTITAFHNDVARRAVRNGASVASFEMLKQQIPLYQERLKDIISDARAWIIEQQRTFNREFEPLITEHMHDVYVTCANEYGPGSYRRMRDHMERYVEDEKTSMFEKAVDHVHGLIKNMIKGLRETLRSGLDAIFLDIQREYSSVLIRQEVKPLDRPTIPRRVLEIVNSAEQVFKQAVGIKPGPAVRPRTQTKYQSEHDEASITVKQEPREDFT
ncbi:uncharacterized protein Z519_01409 [Cladophialophora bantiana CBS 173.52]|uniref:Tat pathway signal sequence n=1 Tax=Cladophialophora bantiana (strain ATCC 10958 / CBS 173.52 / CDC B-1940 / NIH 8579) TaxID=1442370 RepID=A0A0D2I3N2_CLAB1|nr:uncharacterized protein Z519_01409 [Cladophialophora bantiana CBS 173.52]KIW97825.1 hypothetical protein Z519_01409 [Cladophialophora bantiana CBS 173.52]